MTRAEYFDWCANRGHRSLLAILLGSDTEADAWRAKQKRRHHIHWTPPEVWGEPIIPVEPRKASQEAPREDVGKDALVVESPAALVLRQCREAGITLWIEGHWLRSRGWSGKTNALYGRFKPLRNDIALLIKAEAPANGTPLTARK